MISPEDRSKLGLSQGWLETPLESSTDIEMVGVIANPDCAWD